MSREKDVFYWQYLVPELAKELNVDEVVLWHAIQLLCYERFGIEGLQVFGQRIPYEELLSYYRDYDFSLNSVLVESSNGDLHYSLVTFNRARIKHNGKTWIVHKYDIDPFPSNPHAHDLDNSLKLHLGNGFIFDKKKYVGKLHIKEFMEIRAKLEDRNILLPELEYLT